MELNIYNALDGWKKQKQFYVSNEDENEATWILFSQNFIDELKWQRIKNRGKIDVTLP